VALADRKMMAAIAATRFGLGAKPGEIEAAAADPKGYLRAQIRPGGADQPPGLLPKGAQRLAEFRDYQRERREVRLEKAAAAPSAATQPAGDAGPVPPPPGPPKDAVAQVGAMLRQDIGQDFSARLQLAAATDAAFRERWTLFWANHFTVSATKAITGRSSRRRSGPMSSGPSWTCWRPPRPIRPC
jgi:uncharacterized protein (DUF1800 family)